MYRANEMRIHKSVSGLGESWEEVTSVCVCGWGCGGFGSGRGVSLNGDIRQYIICAPGVGADRTTCCVVVRRVNIRDYTPDNIPDVQPWRTCTACSQGTRDWQSKAPD